MLLIAVLGLALFPGGAFAAHNPDDIDPCAGAPSAAGEFTDYEDARDVHQPSIDCALYRALTSGAGNNLYEPMRKVNRGQMAQFIVNTVTAAGWADTLESGEGGDDEYSDIANNTFRLAINSLSRTGIVRGFPDGTYRPGQDISRQQMASFMVQAANAVLPGETEDVQGDNVDKFTDVSARNVHKRNIEDGADSGLFRGTTATTFSPGVDVLRDQMASFLVNLLRFIFAAEQAPPVINVADAAVAPGEPVTGTIAGDARSATVSGCGLSNQSVTDTDGSADGIQFSIQIPTSQTDDCVLTFTITGADGATFTRTVAVDVQAQQVPAGTTDRPDLTQIVEQRYISATQVTTQPGFQRGANFLLQFDEALDACTFGQFRAYSFDGTVYPGTGCTLDPSATNRVFVVFAGVDTQAKYDDLTVIGAEDGDGTGDGAVSGRGTDTNADLNDDNTEGDLAIGGTRQRTTQLAAGVTAAPDLETVAVRSGAVGTGTGTTTRTAVDFTFDENAFIVGTRFFLVPVNGASELECDEPAVGSTTAAGGTVPGGNGTRTITVICYRSTTSTNTSQIAASEVARGGVDAVSVADETQVAGGAAEGNVNPLQVAPVTNNGNQTDAPNLEGVAFRNATDTDLVEFNIDRDVNTTVGGAALVGSRFKVYLDSGEEVTGTVATRSTTAGQADRVLVRFGRDVSGLVGGSILPGAVEQAAGAGTGEDNLSDEEGATPRQSTTTIVGGVTDGPDQTGATVSEVKDQLGTRTGVRLVVTVDENIEDAVTSGVHVFAADGRQYDCTNARVGNPDNTNPQEARNQIICTNFTTTGSFTQSQIFSGVLSAVRATIDQGIVEERGSGTDRNPVGASGITTV